MKHAFLFLANGFEEVEALGTVDILRRSGVDVQTVSITDSKEVTGAHQITVVADVTFAEANFADGDAFILPGGMPGATNLDASVPLKNLLIEKYNDKKLIAAICAAPLVLGGLGFLKGRKATAYPGFEGKLTGATATAAAVEVDENVITGKGPALVFDFGLALVTYLRGQSVAEEVAAGLLL